MVISSRNPTPYSPCPTQSHILYPLSGPLQKLCPAPGERNLPILCGGWIRRRAAHACVKGEHSWWNI